uniref:Uncharacterized protein n=1 Tax=Kalanchoe fedtschenkoi TaxID=63787 RepID=A0A7N0TKS0_KALFE
MASLSPLSTKTLQPSSSHKLPSGHPKPFFVVCRLNQPHPEIHLTGEFISLKTMYDPVCFGPPHSAVWLDSDKHYSEVTPLPFLPFSSLQLPAPGLQPAPEPYEKKSL